MKYLSALISSLFLVGCQTMPISMPMPEKPKVEMGVMDFPRGEAITNQLDLRKIESAEQLKYGPLVKSIKASKYKRVPLLDYDKAIMFKPRAWEQHQNYLDKLVNYIRNHCN